tara:strand:- start:1625 stop:3811 length:2187 start_codon:yes stop_codon:yes gene_type:complete
MPLNLASPGILVREVDLTLGRIDPTTDKIGGIVGPFAQGPVGTPTLVNTENDLLNTFGKPYSTDKQYETWLTASSYLAYGGILNVVRADDAGLYNGFVGAATSTKIKSLDHYEELGYDVNTITNVTVAAKNPGTWSNGIRIGIIDGKADQTLTVNSVGSINIGYGITQTVPAGTVVSKTGVGAGTTMELDGMFKGIVTGISGLTVDVKFISHVSSAGTETAWDYNNIYKFNTGSVTIVNNSGVSQATPTVSLTKDWFDQQELALTTATVGGTETVTTVKWNTVTERPGTSEYVANRGGRFDEVHLVVIDAKGTVTGNAGTILEKHLNLSKAKDAEFSVGSAQYWRKYLETNSEYLFGGSAPVGVVTTGFSNNFTLAADTGWDQDGEGIIFDTIGTMNGVLAGGKNYGNSTDINATGALNSGLDDIISGYGLFENDTAVDVDFLLQGSAQGGEEQTRALATKLIQVAEARKDAIAFISPYRGSMITDTTDQEAPTVLSDADITENVINFFDPITSTSYAVFDSGYKYMFDRFSNGFRYVPLNGDIGGLCARTDINQFPWFSPAGTARGAILNAVKLAYNPNKEQRDRLYSSRINPVIFSPGSGILLFGDKTGYAKASAFDRINVRRLFIFLEDAISAAAKDQLFEFNDEITRTNFVNIVEPFLRDVQAKRGIQDYVVICDETNNTAAIIDANEFVADIYIKPARSINFIGLTFVATRTGVSFDEVIGKV